ncbi:hypothetical protein EDD15DRAFT_2190577 [Pisolithus albus]|nr:hypothetical protein EDD15DRAFT_2190577 [Pisolithus albus]
MAIVKPPKTVTTSGRVYLKQEYYAASAIAGGSGLAYSAEKCANVVTVAGQLVMEDLIETQPEAVQFQRKGFKFWDRMQQFVPPDKPPAQSHMQYQPPPTQSSVQYSFVQYQIKAPDQSTQNVRCGRAASSQTPFVMPNLPQASSAMPSVPLSFPTHPDPTISPSSIPVSPPSSAMTSVDSSIKPSSSILSHGQKCKSDTTAGLDTASVVTTTSSWK